MRISDTSALLLPMDSAKPGLDEDLTKKRWVVDEKFDQINLRALLIRWC
jgi:hypothetical protein